MTKQQATELMALLEAQQMPASAAMSFPAGKPELWSVQLDTSTVFTGRQLAALAAYCSAKGLNLTAQFSTLGVV